MIYSFINVHSYLILNISIITGYLFARIILSFPIFKKRLLHTKRLSMARNIFLFTILSFFIMPQILKLIPSLGHSSFRLEPILQSAPSDILQYSKIHHNESLMISQIQPFISINMVLMSFFIIGFSISLIKYFNSLLTLKTIRRNSFFRHRLSNTEILFNNTIKIPFCWSIFKNHFIVIPSTLLERKEDLRLSIRHELQHIRQGDTQWMHFLRLIKVFCFWNPFIQQCIRWLNELQEFSCDESLILYKKTSPIAYSQCLINTVSDSIKLPQGVLGMHGLSRSILYRRVDFLFNQNKGRKLASIVAYIISFSLAISTAYALNGSLPMQSLSTRDVAAIIAKEHLDKTFNVSASPELVKELNDIRSSNQARLFMLNSLKRMKQYQPMIQQALKDKNMPNDLLIIPLIESGYQPLEESMSPMQTAGIWQIIPVTARRLGLVVNKIRDDRLNIQLSTNAALVYLAHNYIQFSDWKLTFIAYEIGEDKTSMLIKDTGSKDPWVLAHSPNAPEGLKKYIAMFDAALIIMHNPELIGANQ